jgi:hypothetical protein
MPYYVVARDTTAAYHYVHAETPEDAIDAVRRREAPTYTCTLVDHSDPWIATYYGAPIDATAAGVADQPTLFPAPTGGRYTALAKEP